MRKADRNNSEMRRVTAELDAIQSITSKHKLEIATVKAQIQACRLLEEQAEKTLVSWTASAAFFLSSLTFRLRVSSITSN
jgi:hypothetical protein